jgi:hypothetical protein
VVLPGLTPRRRGFRPVPSSRTSSWPASLADLCGHLLRPRHALFASAGSGVGLGAFGTGSPPLLRGRGDGGFQRWWRHGGVPVPLGGDLLCGALGRDRGQCPRTPVLGHRWSTVANAAGGGWMDGGWRDIQSSPHYGCRPNCVRSGPAMGCVWAGGQARLGARAPGSGNLASRSRLPADELPVATRAQEDLRLRWRRMGSGESRCSTGGASGPLCEVFSSRSPPLPGGGS